MKKLLFVALMVFSVAAIAAGNVYRWKVVKVVDGDTLQVQPSWLIPELSPLKVRVLGVDTPEHGGLAKCPSEAALADKAKAFTTAMVNDAIAKKKQITFANIQWDKYGGRVDATVSIAGKDLTTELINAGLARAYDGGKKSSWCPV